MGMRRCWDDGAGVGNTRVVSPEPNRFHGGDEMRYRIDYVTLGPHKSPKQQWQVSNDLVHLVRMATYWMGKTTGHRWTSAHISCLPNTTH